MASPPKDLHFVLFPLMTQGHMIPMFDIARLLAERGPTVTIITTPVNANRFKPVITRAIQEKLKIQVLELELALSEVGLPQGCENFDLIPSAELFPKLFTAAIMLAEPAENMFRGLTPAPSCIISDNLLAWTSDIAQKFNIPRFIFHGPGCFTLLCLHIAIYTNVLDDIAVSDSEYFVLPGLSDRVELTKEQACSWGGKTLKEAADFVEYVRKAEQDANGIVVNSFHELEPKYVEELAKTKDKKVWCIGPVSLCNKSFQDIAERGSKSAIDEQDCLKWLDSKEPESIMFVCLGSLARVCTEQNIDLALGLESSNKSFLWCIRHPTEELEKWFLEEGYEERVKDRGLIIRGWAPQVLVLSHQAVGGFVTHCGWNSTLEAVSTGVPMVTWPQFSDQFINERFIVDVLKVGVKIGMEAPIVVGEQDKFGVVVKKEDVKRSVEDVMDNGEEGEARRKRCRELAELAERAMEDGGSSCLSMTSMIQDIIELCS
ncbi:UDP-glycosyltransferase 73E1-like [Bidens hawaiensis]|uniref:UDP-glycosyltransferase 73E1-like n=1 Tax=Bidens hawaiensis TaxID=980011 RepID=UPI004049DC2E